MDKQVEDLNARLSLAAQEYMKEHSVTQPQVATVLGRTQNYVSGRLIGRHHISADIIMGIAAVAQVPPDWLIQELTQRAAQKAAAGTETPASPDPAGAAG